MGRSICFVTLGNIYLAPYIDMYLPIIPKDYSLHIVYWDREGLGESPDYARTHRFFDNQYNQGSKLSKALGYFKFRRFVKKILREQKFDNVIVLQTITGVLLYSLLTKWYSGRYIIDVRDYSLEKNWLFFALEEKLLKDAAMVLISSEGFKSFLPASVEYYPVHNNRHLDESLVGAIRRRSKSKEVLKIAYIGYMNYHTEQEKLMLLFKNHPRFILKYSGTRCDELREFCAENGIDNVEITGRFDSQNVLHEYYDCDIVNNLYGNNTPVLDYALSNKLYFAASLNMPILVCPNTYMAERSLEHGFGYVVDYSNDSTPDELWQYYSGIDWDSFEVGCSDFLSSVNEQNEKLAEHIRDLLA